MAPGVVSWAGSDSSPLSRRPLRQSSALLDLKSGRFRPDPRLPATAYSVSANGKLLYTLPLSGTSIGVVDLRTMRLERTLKPPPGFIFFDVEPEQGGTVVAVEAPARNNPDGRISYAIWLHRLHRCAIARRPVALRARRRLFRTASAADGSPSRGRRACGSSTCRRARPR